MVVQIIYTYIQEGQPFETTVNTLTKVCVDFKIFSPRVCKGLIEINLPTLLYIQKHTDIIPGNVCGILMVGKNCSLSDPSKLEWSIKLSSVPKPPIGRSSSPIPVIQLIIRMRR